MNGPSVLRLPSTHWLRRLLERCATETSLVVRNRQCLSLRAVIPMLRWCREIVTVNTVQRTALVECSTFADTFA
jgi:hypothetical protein